MAEKQNLGCMPLVVTALGFAVIAGLVALGWGHDTQTAAAWAGTAAGAVLALPVVLLLIAWGLSVLALFVDGR